MSITLNLKKVFILIILLIINFQLFAQAPSIDIKKLGNDIQHIVQKVYQASVLIEPYDATKGNLLPGAFSGVVVDKDGNILSAAHAVKPDQLYQITFANGKKLFARGLGRIVSNDAAMLKMTEKGKWPYAEMGWSSALKIGTPCISIAYPGTVEAKTPTVRFGYVAEPETKNGFMRTTCLMEPGDSGGPVFDMKGRVIGLHSRIEMSLDDNYEIPIDSYRRYWNALVLPENYAALPTENTFEKKSVIKDLRAVSGIGQLSASLNKALIDKISTSSVKIKSPYKGKGIAIKSLGTLVKLDGLADQKLLEHKSFIVAKSSMISNVITIEFPINTAISAKVIARDADNDLALLQVDQHLDGGVDLHNANTSAVRFTDLGKVLVSPRPDEDPIVSVMGNTPIKIAKAPSSAYIGLSPKLTDGKVIAVNLMPGGPASRAKMREGDELLLINGIPIQAESDVSDEVARYTSNDSLTLAFSRNGLRFEKRIAVKVSLPGVELHVASRFEDGKSERHTGFNNVIIHDGRLKPAECGGPLFDTEGQFYGVNIARLSRTSSLSVSATVIRQFVVKHLKD